MKLVNTGVCQYVSLSVSMEPSLTENMTSRNGMFLQYLNSTYLFTV